MNTPKPLPTPTGTGDESRSTRKRRAIIAGATTAFLRKGYLGTNMDEIAALARVSKQTVYKHFADKQSLFSEVVIATVNRASDLVGAEVGNLPESVDLEADLHAFARGQLALVMQPEILQLRRLVTAEADRFPELGRIFYERGPGRTIATLATAFESLAARGQLQLEDALLAASHLNWLIMAAPLNQAMLLGQDELPTAAELNRYADSGVRVFLAAYRNR